MGLCAPRPGGGLTSAALLHCPKKFVSEYILNVFVLTPLIVKLTFYFKRSDISVLPTALSDIFEIWCSL